VFDGGKTCYVKSSTQPASTAPIEIASPRPSTVLAPPLGVSAASVASVESELDVEVGSELVEVAGFEVRTAGTDLVVVTSAGREKL
jgi:hypothetical protein